MGYLDGLINARFKNKDDGRVLFCPYGIFGSGYIITKDTENKIKKFMVRYYIIGFLFILSFYGSVSFEIILSICAVFFYYISLKHFLFGAEKTKERLSMSEVRRNMAISMGAPVAILMVSGSSLFIAIYISLFFLTGPSLWKVIGFLFFLTCFLQSIFLLRHSLRYKKGNK